MTEVPGRRLRRLAEIYGWPLAMLTEPMPTGEELAQERIARISASVIRQGREQSTRCRLAR
ncbi:MAG: hypothetical protein KF809_13610 [Chloroflexi bacterium]|nr:hypothetical protein [Chloroflexota bacterium]